MTGLNVTVLLAALALPSSQPLRTLILHCLNRSTPTQHYVVLNTATTFAIQPLRAILPTVRLWLSTVLCAFSILKHFLTWRVLNQSLYWTERLLFMGFTITKWLDWRLGSKSSSLLHPEYSWFSSNSFRCYHRPSGLLSSFFFFLVISKWHSIFWQFTKTPAYIQIVGFIDNTAIGLDPTDYGGELDPHSADLQGNPLGGVIYSNTSGISSDSSLTELESVSFTLFSFLKKQ